MIRIPHLLITFCGLVLILGLKGCAYSFTGASVDADVKTVSVAVFQNNASQVVPTLSQNFTEALRDKFITQTNLKLAQRAADLQFSGAIVDYAVTPLTIQGDQAAQTRLTLTLNVQYVNLKHPEKGWDETFSNFVDFPKESWPSKEGELVTEVQGKLVQDIFNKALANW